jgi:ribosomal protein S18 acetylase RimI-like enzyme
MIRKRISAGDDRTIYRLVVRQLLPFTRVMNPQAKANYSSVEKRLKDNDFTFVAAHGERTPMGFVTGKCMDRRLFIDMLAMDERYQGRGLGGALMQAAERYGRTKGCTEAFLYVDEVNPRAQMFYLSKGYHFDGYEQSVHCYRMRKPLR